jgi:hypothetical protein
MKPQNTLRPSRSVLASRLFALAPLPLLLTLTQGNLLAQQSWVQNPQYANSQPQYAQPDPYAGQYVPNQQQYPASNQDYAQPNYAQPEYAQPQAPVQQALGPDQLEQLVAPIALYPDALVAQVLAAATYPAQVVGADHWLQAQGYTQPDQIAYSADAQPWDPSVKALTAFPQVLALMDRDLQWTTDLGNAYYNQPQDVLQTIQVLRQRAQSAGTLQNSPQEAVSYNQGYIQLAPPNPQVVYVPAYNPWDVYGQPIQPYSGFSLLGSLESLAGSAPIKYGLGIAMSAFSHTPFGWAGWALNWLTQSILFHQSNYVSQSTSVAHWGNPGNNFPNRYHPPSPQMASNRGGGNFARPGEGYGDYRRPSPQQSFGGQPDRRPQPYSAYRTPEENRLLGQQGRGYQQPNNYVRPAPPTYAYNRPQPQVTMPARPQTYGRPGGYGSSFYGDRSPSYPARPATEFARQQAFREPAPQYNNFAQRSYSQPYSDPRSYSGGRNFEEPKPEHSGGFHMFGGGHNAESSHTSYRAPKEYKAPKMPKAPKGYGGGGGHHSGGGHFGGGGGGHHGGGHRS